MPKRRASDRGVTPAAANAWTALRKAEQRVGLKLDALPDLESPIATLRAWGVLEPEEERAARRYVALRAAVHGHAHARALLVAPLPGKQRLTPDQEQDIEDEYRAADALLGRREREVLQQLLTAGTAAASTISGADVIQLAGALATLAEFWRRKPT
jgi:hypothetical protein